MVSGSELRSMGSNEGLATMRFPLVTASYANGYPAEPGGMRSQAELGNEKKNHKKWE